MAPGRKKGANKAKGKNDLSLGDLVLAKVKGFPAWPAKISRPEDWEHSPDPRKYFVEFFGTKEIAFVAPVDIQAFTSEVKTRVLNRVQGNKVKFFAQAVNEICEAFEELQQQKPVNLKENIEGSVIECKDSTGDGLNVDSKMDVMNENSKTDVMNVDSKTDVMNVVGSNAEVTQGVGGDTIPGLERCSNKLSATDGDEDIKPSTSGHGGDGLSSAKNHKVCDNVQPKMEASLVSTPENLSCQKENVSGDKDDDNICTKRSKVSTVRKRLNSRKKNYISDSEDDSSGDMVSGKKDGFASEVVTHDAKNNYGGQKTPANGQKSKKVIAGSERKRESGSSAVTSSKDRRTGGCDAPASGDRSKDERKSKISSGDSRKKLSTDASKSSLEVGGGKRVKDELKSKKTSDIVDCKNISNTEDQAKGEYSGKEKKVQLGKRNAGSIQIAHPAKKSKRADPVDDSSKRLHPKNVKSVSPSSIMVDDKSIKHPDIKISTSRTKTENHSISRTRGESIDSKVPDDEPVLPQSKRHHRALAATRDSSNSISNESSEKVPPVRNVVSANKVSGTTSHKKRRAVCLFEDEDDVPPKTPVHGGSAKKNRPSSAVDTIKIAEPKLENSNDAHQSIKDDNVLEDKLPKEQSSEVPNESPLSSQPQALMKRPKKVTAAHVSNSPSNLESDEVKQQSSEVPKGSPLSSQPQALMKRPKKVTAAHVSNSPSKLESDEVKEPKPIITSPKKSPQTITASGNAVEQHKVTKPAAKFSVAHTQKKSQAGAVKGSGAVSHSLVSSQNQVPVERKKSASSIERSKTLPKSNSRMKDSAVLSEVVDPSFLSGDRPEASREDKTMSLLDSRISDSALSMKDLIAVAQAKRKQAHSQSFFIGNPNSAFLSITDLHGTNLSPSSALQPFLTDTSITMNTDIHGFHNRTASGSPSAHGQQSSSQNQLDHEEVDERRVSSEHRDAGGSLSGGTEAAVARDAFEGMIETLSRTKESIGRATRLAIECTKYGIANEVVDILIRKLEAEPSSHRKVDLFFLVDSITQCSHNQKGIAGASYIPAVQTALPRLLGAAAPPGAGGRENRRQCLKVLRLWLERKILPESLLRRYMDDMGVPNDDISAGFFLKRPSRAERAIDDPIREMEGMLVDEYGSNATFQLPGLLSCHVFDDDDDNEEDDLPSSSCKEAGVSTPVESSQALGESEMYAVTPNDRRHCILEDVDGELEMEDVSGPSKGEKPVSANGSYDTDLKQQCAGKILESGSNISFHSPFLLEGSPPLPLDSPPPQPPLPSSPPPPPLSPSPPPPPPPPSFSPPPPVPPTGPPPPLPPPPIPPLGLPSMAPQPSVVAGSLLPPLSALPSSSQLAYQPTIPQGNQIIQTAGSTCHGGHINTSRQLEYGHNDLYMNPQASQPNQQFQQGNAPFGQRPLHPAPPQPPSSHFSYSNPTVPQHNQHPYPRPYPTSSHSDGRQRYVSDEQWRMPASEFSANNQHAVWMGGSRPLSCSGTSYVQEGYFRTHHEKPPSNNMSFQHPAPNNPPAVAPVQGHGVPQIIPGRPDMSAHTSWRPS